MVPKNRPLDPETSHWDSVLRKKKLHLRLKTRQMGRLFFRRKEREKKKGKRRPLITLKAFPHPIEEVREQLTAVHRLKGGGGDCEGA